MSFGSKEVPIDRQRLTTLLAAVQAGEVSISEALDRLKSLPFEDLGFAKVDHHRSLRKGFPEVVLGEGKSPQQVAEICQELARHSDVFLVTRTSEEAFQAVQARVPDAVYRAPARLIVLDRRQDLERLSGVAVLCGGTADLPVAEEAAITAEVMGCEVQRVYDVGVAGLHRLLSQLPLLQEARVLVVVAGMEGALPSLVGGLVSAPVIAVPTSIGYGASFGGLAPLLAMLTSCAPGVAVVNINNGFGAGYLAAVINLMASQESQATRAPVPAKHPRNARSRTPLPRTPSQRDSPS